MNNMFNGSTNDSIYIGGQKNLVVTPECGTTLLKSKCSNIVIQGNIIEGAKQDAIEINWCTSVIISDNLMNGNYRGVRCLYSDNVKIHDNTITNSTTEAFFNYDADTTYKTYNESYDHFIRNNFIKKCGQYGIREENTNGVFVDGNVLKDCANVDVTRDSILIANTCKDGRVTNNSINSPKNKYCINVTETCTDIQTFNNKCVGGERRQLVVGVTNYDGFLVYSNGEDESYRVTMGDDGQFRIDLIN